MEGIKNPLLDLMDQYKLTGNKVAELTGLTVAQVSNLKRGLGNEVNTKLLVLVSRLGKDPKKFIQDYKEFVKANRELQISKLVG